MKSTIKSSFKSVYKKSPILRYLFLKYLSIRKYYRVNFLSEESFTKLKFKEGMGYELNLTNPLTLNEKINWLMLNDRTSLHTICADKYTVREHIAKKIGNEYLVPLVFKTKKTADISPEIIPNYPVIIKTNHNSFGLEIIRDKSTVNWNDVRKKFKKLLNINYYNASKQWQYKNIEPLIIIEKLLMDKNGNVPADYKFHCFNGKVRMVSIDMDRGLSTHSRSWYNRNWEREPFSWSNKRKNGGYTDPLPYNLPKPKSFEKMIDLSEKLADDFDYVRVDWYNIEGKLYFGELTFHHSGGRCPILPREWDKILGEQLKFIKTKEKVK